MDRSGVPLEWARPDLHGLRQFAASKFFWTEAKADELLLPVMKEYEITETQTRIDAYFGFEQRFARCFARDMWYVEVIKVRH